MDVARYPGRRRLAVLLLGAVAAVLASGRQAVAQDPIPTYELNLPGVGIIDSLQSASGVAVVATHWQPVAFQILGVDSGWEYGRFVADGSALTMPDSAFHGPYLMSRNAGSKTSWAFADPAQLQTTATKAVYPGEAIGGFPSSTGWIQYNLYVDLEDGYTTQGWPAHPSSGVATAWPEVPQIDTAATSFIQSENRREWQGHTDTDGGAMERYWRRQYPGGETWFYVGWTPSTNPTQFQHQADIHVFTLEVTADPFKGTDGPGGTFDPSGIINAIVAQSTMQEGYYQQWDTILTEFDAQLTGELSGKTWEARDVERNASLGQIAQSAGQINTTVSLMHQLLSTIQQSVSTSGVLDTVDESVPVFVPLDDNYVANKMDLPALDPEWDALTPPPESSLAVWEFTIPTSLAGIGFGNPMSDIVMRVDLTMVDPFLAIVHPPMLVLLSVWGAGRVWQEFRRG